MDEIVQKSCKFCGRFSAQVNGRCPHCGNSQKETIHCYTCWLVLAFTVGALLALIFY